jgi:transposase
MHCKPTSWRILGILLAREEKAHVSPSSVYRVLKSEGLVPPHVFGKPHREKVKPDPKRPHEDWMIDIT